MRKFVVLAAILIAGLAGLLFSPVSPLGALSPFGAAASSAPTSQPAIACDGIVVPCH